jgi:preprotein translocase subunit SecY
VNPNQIAEDLKRNNGFVPGVKPGLETADHISAILDRITLPSALFLALISILPAFAVLLGVGRNFALFFGGTSLIIMVQVMLDTLQEIESYLLMKEYEGMMSSGKLKGTTENPYVPV